MCYAQRVQRKHVIIQDTREKLPLLLPKRMVMLDDTKPASEKKMVTVELHTVRQKLPTGDYVLSGSESTCIVERKGSILEISKNVLDKKDRQRFVRELVRLREETSHPVLVLEGSPSQLLDSREGSIAVDALIRLLQEYGVELLLLPSGITKHRRALGEWVARLLINRTLHG
jgi:ERCC4-type nuclease